MKHLIISDLNSGQDKKMKTFAIFRGVVNEKEGEENLIFAYFYICFII